MSTQTARASGAAEPSESPPQPRRKKLRSEGLEKWQVWALRCGSVLAILLIWEVYGRLTSPILFTYPTAIARAAVDMTLDGTLIGALGQSLAVLSVGFVVGTALGIAFGLLAGRSDIAAAILDLPVNALYATPMVALIPVLVLWFGFGTLSKIVIVTLFVVFPVLINTTRGVREVDPKLVEVAHTFRSSERRIWLDLVLPSALPYIVTGIRLAIGRGLIGVVVAEFYTALAGLGFLVVSNANSFQTARTFVPIVLLMILGVGLTALLGWLETRIAPWRSAAR